MTGLGSWRHLGLLRIKLEDNGERSLLITAAPGQSRWGPLRVAPDARPSQFFAVSTSNFNITISSSAYFQLEKPVGVFWSCSKQMSIFLLVLFRQWYKWICQSDGTKHTAPFPLDDDTDCKNDYDD